MAMSPALRRLAAALLSALLVAALCPAPGADAHARCCAAPDGACASLRSGFACCAPRPADTGTGQPPATLKERGVSPAAGACPHAASLWLTNRLPEAWRTGLPDLVSSHHPPGLPPFVLRI
jgi:hypothetical protein